MEGDGVQDILKIWLRWAWIIWYVVLVFESFPDLFDLFVWFCSLWNLGISGDKMREIHRDLEMGHRMIVHRFVAVASDLWNVRVLFGSNYSLFAKLQNHDNIELCVIVCIHNLYVYIYIYNYIYIHVIYMFFWCPLKGCGILWKTSGRSLT